MQLAFEFPVVTSPLVVLLPALRAVLPTVLPAVPLVPWRPILGVALVEAPGLLVLVPRAFAGDFAVAIELGSTETADGLAPLGVAWVKALSGWAPSGLLPTPIVAIKSAATPAAPKMPTRPNKRRRLMLNHPFGMFRYFPLGAPWSSGNFHFVPSSRSKSGGSMTSRPLPE